MENVQQKAAEVAQFKVLTTLSADLHSAKKTLAKVLIILSSEKEDGYKAFAGLNIQAAYENASSSYQTAREAAQDVDEMLLLVEQQCNILNTVPIISNEEDQDRP